MTNKYTNKNGVKLLAAIAAITMLFAGAFIIVGNTDSDGAESTEATPIKSAEELIANLAEGKGGDLILTADITISDAIAIGASATINLNGHTVTNTSETEGTIFDITASKNTIITITGDGVLSNAAKTSTAIIDCRSTSKVTLDGVTIIANGYGIAAWTGANLIIEDATITSRISAISGNGNESGTAVTINGGTFTSTENAAIYFPSTQKLDINGGTFNGKTGIDIRAGTITIDKAIINVNQTGTISQTPKEDNGPSTM